MPKPQWGATFEKSLIFAFLEWLQKNESVVFKKNSVFLGLTVGTEMCSCTYVKLILATRACVYLIDI